MVLLFGIYWRRTTPQGAIWAMLVTCLVGFFWVIFKSVYGHFPLHPGLSETYASVIVATASTVLFSTLTTRRKKETELAKLSDGLKTS